MKNMYIIFKSFKYNVIFNFKNINKIKIYKIFKIICYNID